LEKVVGGVAQPGLLDEQLDLTGRVAQHAEGELPLPAVEHKAARDGGPLTGLGAGLDAVVRVVDLGRGVRTIEADWIRVDAARAQRFDLGDALLFQVFEPVRHRGEGYTTARWVLGRALPVLDVQALARSRSGSRIVMCPAT
jgi:hypothetical protein